ncbi:MAG: thiazole synthase [Alphaproteobacteria bacterium]|nr:thiazole synthase [Alphaproteobacteria bacterium]
MLTLGDTPLDSRLIVGTGKYPSFEVMQACHQASGTGLVTVAIRRVDLNAGGVASILDHIDREQIRLLPNTAGCYTADEAVITARLARELLGTSLLKLEVIGDPKTLFPDIEGTLEAARVLVEDGFTVLPYCLDDPVSCQRLEEIGCAAVMPLAAPIGSGLGLRNPTNLALILEAVSVPVIVDAGLGTPSDAAMALELGCDAVLLNTAIASAKDPVKMARAFRLAVESGRLAFEAGRMPRKLYASASSPLDGLIQARRPA